MQYSGVREGRPRAMLLEVAVTSVDRGACIRDFSQYPTEVRAPADAPRGAAFDFFWPETDFAHARGEEGWERKGR